MTVHEQETSVHGAHRPIRTHTSDARAGCREVCSAYGGVRAANQAIALVLKEVTAFCVSLTPQ